MMSMLIIKCFSYGLVALSPPSMTSWYRIFVYNCYFFLYKLLFIFKFLFIVFEVLRDTAVVPRCHLLFVRTVPYYLSGKASFKLY